MCLLIITKNQKEYHSNDYTKHNDLQNNLKLKSAADYECMLRMLHKNKISVTYLPRVITKMRVGGASNRSLNNIIQKTKEDYRAVTSNKVGGFFTILRKNTSKIKQFF